MRAESEHYPVARMAEQLSVSRQGYHAWLKRLPSARALAKAQLRHEIHEAFSAHGGRIGAPARAK